MTIQSVILALALTTAARADGPALSKVAIFPPEHKHNHASCVVELPGGDLFAAWYSGSGERQADDVEIQGARFDHAEGIWGPRFRLADTPGYPDCNPALFAAPDGTFWLFYPTILDHRWEGALLKFAVARDVPAAPRPPAWVREGVLHVTPVGFDAAMTEALNGLKNQQIPIDETRSDRLLDRARDPLYQRLGWMPRVHPTVLASGRWLLPLYSDTFSCSIVLRSDDRGAGWTPGTPMIGFGNIQPSLVQRRDGTVVAFMRDNGPRRHIRLSTSKDDGISWSPVVDSDMPNPGSGLEALRLASGNWALVANDTERGRHSLVVRLSDDEGRTWKWSRHIEKHEPGHGHYHYPSIIQAYDGIIHVTYTRGSLPDGSTIVHARFDEAWIRAGDPNP
ncbi:MAG TPA: exo-alpha-sialidase [Isosphaeraceae bacterium]|jgi:predicted neuraminidase|nr:exo-alpha-sialidase [Isosphaeraceae bacterium]